MALKPFFLLITLLLSQMLIAQNIGINGNGAAPDPSAMLDIDVSAVTGTKTGLLIPRMNSAQRAAIPTPATGLLVYDTSTDEFWYYDGTAWVNLLSATAGWRTTGNAGTVDGTHFVGTTDNVPLNFRVNGVEAGRIGNADLNTYFGYGSGLATTSGTANVAIGHDALGSNTSGGSCVAVGHGALSTANGRNGIVAIGDSALGNSNANWNTAVGYHAMKNSTSGFANTAIGFRNNSSNTSGYRNTSIGTDCFNRNTSGAMNSVMGYFTLRFNTTGHRNVALGAYAGQYNTTGFRNTFVGLAAGEQNTTAERNTYLGYHAGSQNQTGSMNTFVGHTAGYSSVGLTRATAIGYNAQVSSDNSLVLGGTGVDAVHVGIGVTAPTAELEVNGYTKLGSAAPAIQMIKLTGTTHNSQGGTVNIPHGLDATKILAVDVHVKYNNGGWVPSDYDNTIGYEFEYYYDLTYVYVRNVSGSSAQILGDPITILVTYEE